MHRDRQLYAEFLVFVLPVAEGQLAIFEHCCVHTGTHTRNHNNLRTRTHLLCALCVCVCLRVCGSLRERERERERERKIRQIDKTGREKDLSHHAFHDTFHIRVTVQP
jgi:hypothetical protein